MDVTWEFYERGGFLIRILLASSGGRLSWVGSSPARWLKLCSEAQIPKVDFEPRLGLRKLQTLVFSGSGKVNRLSSEHYLGHLTGLAVCLSLFGLADLVSPGSFSLQS